MRTALAVALVALSAIAPQVRAQVPPFVTAWGSFGSGNGQFMAPVGVAVDAEGIVYVVDTNLGCLKRFSRTGTYLSQWPVTSPQCRIPGRLPTAACAGALA